MEIKRFSLGELGANCYLVWSDSGEAVVIDPGGESPEVKKFITENNIKLKMVILTHGHGDHIGGVSYLRPFSDGGVAIHADDADCLTDAGVNLSGAMGRPVATAQAEKLLQDGDEFSVGGMKVKVIHTPGHTKGSCSFDISEGFERAVFTGDTLFARSVGRTDLPGGSESELRSSIEKLSKLPAYLQVYPGHGPDTTLGEERANNPFWPR